MKAQVVFICLLSILVAAIWMGCSQDTIDPVATSTSVNGDQFARGGTVSDGSDPVQVKSTVGIPARCTVDATAEGCYNNPGPMITLNGEISLGGLNGLLIYRNNLKGTHEGEADLVVSVVILEDGKTIQFPKQPPLGGVGGNPWIYVQLTNGKNKPMCDEILLGRCVQGLTTKYADFNMFGDAFASVTTADCDNSGGPQITLNGELKLGGINANLIFRNNAKGTHERYEETTVSIVLIPKDESLTFSKKPPEGGAGGNPHLFFAFADKDGNPISDEFYLGRCVQLIK